MNQSYLSKQGSLRRFFSMLWKARLPYLAILGYMGISAVITNIVVDTTEYSAEMFAGNVSFAAVVLPFLIYTLLSLILGTVSTILSSVCKALIDRNMRLMVWKKIVRLPMHAYAGEDNRQMISRVTTDVTAISNLIMNVFVLMLNSLYTVAVTFSRVAQYDTRLVLCMFVIVPVNVCLSLIMGRVRFGTSNVHNQANAEYTRVVSEDMANIRTIKAAGQEAPEFERVGQAAKRLYKATIRSSWMGTISNPAYAVASCMQFMILVLVGRSFYAAGAITLPQWIAFYAFSNSVISVVNSLFGNWVSLKSSQGATDRISSIMELPDEGQEAGEPVDRLEGDIVFENVSFAYGDTPLFENLNLRLEAGKTTAIIGHSGSGKTTLLNLIERFYPLGAGTLRIGEKSVADYRLKDYRRLLGYITQECTVLEGTLRENLLCGAREPVSDEALLEACRQVGLEDFLGEHPEGLDFRIGESGATLSGGQRQRICIARMLLNPPEYLLLDEVTSAVDIQSREDILNTLLDKMRGRTVIAVTHDAQTVRRSDHLIVMDHGRIVEQGDTQTLLANSELVRSLMGEEAAV